MIAIIYTLLIRVLVKFKDENNLQLRRVKYKSLTSPLAKFNPKLKQGSDNKIRPSSDSSTIAHATAFHSERSSVENRTLQQR